MGVRKRKSRYGLIASLVAALGLVLAMIGAPASATSPAAGELTFTGTAHLPVFPDNIGSTADGHFYGQLNKAELAGQINGTTFTVEAASDPTGDNDLYAQFDYEEDNCEVGTASGSGWFYLANSDAKTAESDVVVGVYGTTPVTSVYGQFDFDWNRIGTTATIQLSNVNVWVNANIDDNYDSVEKGDDHPDVLPAPDVSDKAEVVVEDHTGLGEALFEPLNPDHIAEACPENATAGDLHAAVQGEAQIN